MNSGLDPIGIPGNIHAALTAISMSLTPAFNREYHRFAGFGDEFEGSFGPAPPKEEFRMENRDLMRAGIAVLCFCGLSLVPAGCRQADRSDLVNRRIASLGDADKHVRYNAAIALGAIKDPRAVEPLIAALKDQDEDVRGQAAGALGEIGDPRAVEPLIAVLAEEGLLVPRLAAGALGKIGLPAVEALFAAMASEDIMIQRRAIEALGMIKAPRVVDLLAAALKDARRDVRRNAAETLGITRDPRAVEPLLAGLKDEDGDVRENAARALGMIGDSAVESLIAAIKDADQDVRQNAALALGMINGRRAAGSLLSALKAKDLAVVAGAYGFFIERGEAGSEDVLIDALNAFGGVEMAQAFMNCGNAALDAAGHKWATEKGYYTIPEIRHFQPGRWGDRR